MPVSPAGTPSRMVHVHTLGAGWVEMAQPVLAEKETAVRQVNGLPPEIRLVPLGGHTAGHTGVAVRDGDRWLLHCGDADYYHRELHDDPHPHPLLDLGRTSSEVHHDRRLGTQARLRELVRDHGDEVSVFSAHDPWELERVRTLYRQSI